MKNLVHVAAFALAALAFTGCAVDEAEPGTTATVVNVWELDTSFDVPGDAFVSHATDARLPSDDDAYRPGADAVQFELPAEESGVCECTTEACDDAWIAENIGCGFCVLIECDGGSHGGCVPCAE